MPPKADWDKYVAPLEDEEAKPEEKIVPLSEGDIQVLRTYVCAFFPVFMVANGDGSSSSHNGPPPPTTHTHTERDS